MDRQKPPIGEGDGWEGEVNGWGVGAGLGLDGRAGGL
jgi:hypothetical protein